MYLPQVYIKLILSYSTYCTSNRLKVLIYATYIIKRRGLFEGTTPALP